MWQELRSGGGGTIYFNTSDASLLRKVLSTKPTAAQKAALTIACGANGRERRLLEQRVVVPLSFDFDRSPASLTMRRLPPSANIRLRQVNGTVREPLFEVSYVVDTDFFSGARIASGPPMAPGDPSVLTLIAELCVTAQLLDRIGLIHADISGRNVIVNRLPDGHLMPVLLDPDSLLPHDANVSTVSTPDWSVPTTAPADVMRSRIGLLVHRLCTNDPTSAPDPADDDAPYHWETLRTVVGDLYATGSLQSLRDLLNASAELGAATHSIAYRPPVPPTVDPIQLPEIRRSGTFRTGPDRQPAVAAVVGSSGLELTLSPAADTPFSHVVVWHEQSDGAKGEAMIVPLEPSSSSVLQLKGPPPRTRMTFAVDTGNGGAPLFSDEWSYDIVTEGDHVVVTPPANRMAKT